MRVFHSVCVCVCVCVSDGKEETEMVGPIRPQFVLFGSSVVQLSYSDEGWGAILTDIYARKVLLQFLSFSVSGSISIGIWAIDTNLFRTLSDK